MGIIITFDYAKWVQLFPNFAYISEPQAQLFFDLATQWCRNDGDGPVGGWPGLCNFFTINASAAAIQTQTNFLNLLTAHLAQLFAPSSTGAAPSGLVGRITSASEGSVSVATEFPMTANSAWFNQTPYGSAFWSASAPFRTMRYIVAPPKPTDPWVLNSGFWPGRWGGL